MLDKLVMSGLIHTNTGVNTIHSKWCIRVLCTRRWIL